MTNFKGVSAFEQIESFLKGCERDQSWIQAKALQKVLKAEKEFRGIIIILVLYSLARFPETFAFLHFRRGGCSFLRVNFLMTWMTSPPRSSMFTRYHQYLADERGFLFIRNRTVSFLVSFSLDFKGLQYYFNMNMEKSERKEFLSCTYNTIIQRCC